VKAAAVVLLLVLAACYTSPPGATTLPSSSAAQPPSPSPGVIVWPAISADDTDSFGIDISGTGATISKVDIRHRFGTVMLGGRPVSALVYKGIPWNTYSLVLYQALAVEPHSWTVFWFYCTGRALTYVYWESTTSSKLNKEPMTGSCTSSTGQTAVSWPAGSMAPPAVVKGFSAHGADIEINSAAAGHLVLATKTWLVYPFTVVDCSKTCGTPGWYELHSILWDGQTGEAAYGIFYLTAGQTHRVQLEYTFELSSLGRPGAALYQADWSRS
jgi:hypothetical protein